MIISNTVTFLRIYTYISGNIREISSFNYMGSFFLESINHFNFDLSLYLSKRRENDYRLISDSSNGTDPDEVQSNLWRKDRLPKNPVINKKGKLSGHPKPLLDLRRPELGRPNVLNFRG